MSSVSPPFVVAFAPKTPKRMAESKPHVTETPEFKKWFGESKVVDESGKPRVVYHGSTHAIDEFRRGGPQVGNGIFFAADPDMASRFTHARGGNVAPVYLKASKPWDYQNDADLKAYQDHLGLTDEDVELWQGHDGGESWMAAAKGNWDHIESPEFQNFLKKNGYDAYWTQEGGDRAIAVYEPTQIKSAIANKSFDPTNPKITKSRYARAFSPSRLAAEPDPDRYEDLGSEEKHHERIAEDPDSAAAYLDYAHFLESEGKEQTADLIRQWVDQQKKKYGLKNLPDFIPRAPLIDMGESQPDGREHFVSGNIPGKVTMSIPSEVKDGHHLFFDVNVPKDQARFITSKLEDEGSLDTTLSSDKAKMPGRDKFGNVAFDPKKWDELLLEAAKKDRDTATNFSPIHQPLVDYMEATGHPFAPLLQYVGKDEPDIADGRDWSTRNIANVAPSLWSGKLKGYHQYGPRSGKLNVRAIHGGGKENPPTHYEFDMDLEPIDQKNPDNEGSYVTRTVYAFPHEMPEIADALHHAGDPIHMHVAKHFPHLYPYGLQFDSDTGLDMDEDFNEEGKLTARGEKKVENPLAKFARAFRLSRKSDEASEPEEKKYGYVGINLTGELADQIRDLAAQIPDEDLAEDGREESPHVTVRYGFHDDVTPEDMAAILKGAGSVKAKVSGLDVFRNDDADVLFATVDSPDLHRLHESLEGLPHTDTHDEYHPHATIAYLKPGTADKYLKSLAAPKGEAVADSVIYSDAARNETEIPLSGDLSPDRFARAFSPARLSLPTLGKARQAKTHLGEAVFHHPFHDENGAELGTVSVIPRGDTLHVHWVGMKGAGADQRPEEAIGTEGVRSLTKQLASAYPEQREITGHRISGANAGRRVRMPLRKMASAFGPARLSREDHAAMMASIGQDQVGKPLKDYDHTGPLVMADFLEENDHPATADYIRRSHQFNEHPDDIHEHHLEGQWGSEGHMEFGDDLGPDTGVAPMQLHYSTYTFPTGEKGFHFGPMLGFPGLIDREYLGAQPPRVGGRMYSVGRNLFDKLRGEATAHVVQGDNEMGDNVGGHGDGMAEADGVIDRFFGSTPERKMCGKPSRKSRLREALRRLAASDDRPRDFIESLRQLRSKSQTQLHSVAKDIAKSLNLDPSRTRDALHDGPTGATPSIAQAVWNAPDKDHVRYAAAWYGLLTKTPSLAVFHASSTGPDSLYKFRYEGSADDLRKQMDREGLPNRVLMPHKTGYDVLIFDPGKRQREKVAAFAKARKLPVEESVGKGEMHGSSDPTDARADYRKTITKFEQGPKRMARSEATPKRCAEGETLGPLSDTTVNMMHAAHADPHNRTAVGVLADSLEENDNKPNLANFLRFSSETNADSHAAATDAMPGNLGFPEVANPGSFSAHRVGYNVTFRGQPHDWVNVYHRPIHDPSTILRWSTFVPIDHLENMGEGMANEGVHLVGKWPKSEGGE